MQYRRTVSIVFPFLLLVITVLACTIAPSGGRTGTTPSLPSLHFDVRQEAKVVWAGSEDPLPELSSSEFQPLGEGDRVSTDWQGEALLQADSPNGVCQVYLFQESSLVKRACPRAQAGNSSCLEEGSAVYNNCSNHIVMTPSA